MRYFLVLPCFAFFLSLSEEVHAGGCKGTPFQCSTLNQYSCMDVVGCTWRYTVNRCRSLSLYNDGYAQRCEVYDYNSYGCIRQGCRWSGPADAEAALGASLAIGAIILALAGLVSGVVCCCVRRQRRRTTVNNAATAPANDPEDPAFSNTLTLERKAKKFYSCYTFQVSKNGVDYGELKNGQSLVIPGIALGDEIEVRLSGTCKTSCAILQLTIQAVPESGQLRARIKKTGDVTIYILLATSILCLIAAAARIIIGLVPLLLLMLASSTGGYKYCRDSGGFCCGCGSREIVPCRTNNSDIENGSLLVQGYTPSRDAAASSTVTPVSTSNTSNSKAPAATTSRALTICPVKKASSTPYKKDEGTSLEAAPSTSPNPIETTQITVPDDHHHDSSVIAC